MTKYEYATTRLTIEKAEAELMSARLKAVVAIKYMEACEKYVKELKESIKE